MYKNSVRITEKLHAHLKRMQYQRWEATQEEPSFAELLDEIFEGYLAASGGGKIDIATATAVKPNRKNKVG